jgi:hypothetical protein
MKAPSWPVRPTAFPVLVDEPDDFLVQLAQHHLDDVHHPFVGDAHSLRNSLSMPIFSRGRRSAGHRRGRSPVHPDELQHHDVARESGFQRRLDHRIAAVLDDDRLVVKRWMWAAPRRICAFTAALTVEGHDGERQALRDGPKALGDCTGTAALRNPPQDRRTRAQASEP